MTPAGLYRILVLMEMTVAQFDSWCRGFLEIEAMERVDPSLNGLQIGDGVHISMVKLPEPWVRLFSSVW